MNTWISELKLNDVVLLSIHFESNGTMFSSINFESELAIERDHTSTVRKARDWWPLLSPYHISSRLVKANDKN